VALILQAFECFVDYSMETIHFISTLHIFELLFTLVICIRYAYAIMEM